MPSSDSGSQTVTRALQLLECFSAEEPEHTATELSVKTGLTVPTTHRLLRTLATRGFLYLNADTKRYSLGPAVLQLAGAILRRDNVVEIVTPVLEHLRRRSGETAGLLWLVDRERVCIAERVSHQSIRMSSGIGRRHPLYAGASGKIMLAHLPDAERATYLDQAYAASAIRMPRVDFEATLVRARSDGWATSVGETVEGAAALAVAILDSSGYPIGAINVTGPAQRWTIERMTSFVPELRSALAAVEAQMGHVRDV